MHLMIKMLELHDQNTFEILAFSFGPELKDDAFQNRVRACVHSFYDVSKKSDLDISNLARELELDIGVDLKGHTTDCRPRYLPMVLLPYKLVILDFQGP